HQGDRGRAPAVDAAAVTLDQRAIAADVVAQADGDGVGVRADAAAADAGVVVAHPARDRDLFGEQPLRVDAELGLAALLDAGVLDGALDIDVGRHVADDFAADVAARRASRAVQSAEGAAALQGDAAAPEPQGELVIGVVFAE